MADSTKGVLRTTVFQHQGRTLEVRAVVADNEVQVRVFEKDKQVHPLVYSVTIETDFDLMVRGFSKDSISNLMELAEEDVEEGRVPLLDTPRDIPV